MQHNARLFLGNAQKNTLLSQKIDVSIIDTMLTNYKQLLQNQLELFLRIKVTPNAPKTEYIETVHYEGEETLKIKVQAPAQDGKANKELTRFLSKELAIAKNNITIVSGEKNPLKLLKITSKA